MGSRHIRQRSPQASGWRRGSSAGCCGSICVGRFRPIVIESKLANSGNGTSRSSAMDFRLLARMSRKKQCRTFVAVPRRGAKQTRLVNGLSCPISANVPLSLNGYFRDCPTQFNAARESALAHERPSTWVFGMFALCHFQPKFSEARRLSGRSAQEFGVSAGDLLPPARLNLPRPDRHG
jgi:hypothetical protein